MTAPSRTLITCALAMAVFGLVLALPGAAFGLESVRTQLGLGVEGQARLLAVLFAGFLVGTTVSGPLADHVGLRPVLAGALVTVAVGLLWFVGSASAGHALAAVLVLGVGGASINTTANTLVSALYPDRRSAMLTWLALACAMGGMALPLLVLTGGGAWTMVLLSAAGLSIVVSGGIARVEWSVSTELPLSTEGSGSSDRAVPTERPRGPFNGTSHEEARAVHAFSWKGLRDVVGAPAFGWYLAALVCQGGSEAALAGWLTPHLTARGMSGSWALTALTCHWIGIILGRLCMAVIVERLGTRMTIASGAIVAALGTTLLITARGPVGLLAAATIAGLGISGVFSVVMADAGARYRGRAGTMFAALLAAGQVGGMLIPWLVGRIGEAASLDAGLTLVVVTTLAVAAITLRTTSNSEFRVQHSESSRTFSEF